MLSAFSKQINREPSLQNGVVHLFINPNRQSTAVFFVTIIILLSFYILFYYREVTNNWDKYKCRPFVMMMSQLFGKNSQETLEKCLKKTQSEAIYNSMQQLKDELKTTNYAVSDIKNNPPSNTVNFTSKVTNSVNGANGANMANDTVNNISITIQKNIIDIKNSINKMLGAFVLSTYMTQGAITTTQGLENGELSTVLKNITGGSTNIGS
jgi:hypothetical protein